LEYNSLGDKNECKNSSIERLTCGKIKIRNKKSKEYAVNKKGEATNKVLNQGLLGNLIDIDSEGNISAKTITF
jgi:hypothetical protein